MSPCGADGVGAGAGQERAERIASFLAQLREPIPDKRFVRCEPAGAFAGAAGCGEIGDAFTGFGEGELRLHGVGERGEQGGDLFRSAGGEQGGGEREGEFEALRIAGERVAEALGGGGGIAGVEQEIAAEVVELGIGRGYGETTVEPCGGGGDVVRVQCTGGGPQGDRAVEGGGLGRGRVLEKGGRVGFAVLGHEFAGACEQRLGGWNRGHGWGEERAGRSVGRTGGNRNKGNKCGYGVGAAEGQSMPETFGRDCRRGAVYICK